MEAGLSKALFPIKSQYFLYYAAYGILNSFVNIYYISIGLSGAQVGWISSVAPLMIVLAAPLWGGLTDRLGNGRGLLMVAVLGNGAAVAGLLFAGGFAGFLILTVVYSFFGAAILPIVDSSNLAILGDRRTWYGRQRIWGSIGFIISTSVAGFIFDRTGLRAIFPAYAALLGLLFIAVLLMPARRVRLSAAFWSSLGQLGRQPAWVYFTVSLFVASIAISGMNNFLSIYLRAEGADKALIGIAWSLGAVSELPVMFFSAWLLAHIGFRRMLVIAFLVYTVRFVLYSLMPNPTWALAIALMHGLSFGFYWNASVIYANQLAPENLKATAQALFVATVSLANVTTSPVSGLLLDRVGPHVLFFLYAVCALLAFGVLLLGFYRTRV